MKNWEANIRRVVPYTPGEQPAQTDIIKLNTNENPYPPAPGVQEALKSLSADRLRRYPDPACEELVRAIAEFYGLSPEQVFVGVGSDDVLAMCFLTFFNSCKPILFPDITYSFYDVWAELFRIPYRQPALDENFHIRKEDYFWFFNSCKPILFPDITYSFYDVWAELFRIPYRQPALDENFHIRKEDYFCENGGIIFPNPNAPTGVELPLEEIEEILKHNPDVIVIVDEAYVDFGAQSVLPLVEKYDNLLVVQTFSKSRSLAGMRIGFACGNPALIRYLNDVKYSFNSYTMDCTALAAGTAAVKDRAYFEETCRKIVETREWTKRELRSLGFSFEDSKGNFIFAAHESCPAQEIFEMLRKKRVYVRYFQKERISNYLRITIGTQQEMETLIEILREYLDRR